MTGSELWSVISGWDYFYVPSNFNAVWNSAYDEYGKTELVTYFDMSLDADGSDMDYNHLTMENLRAYYEYKENLVEFWTNYYEACETYPSSTSANEISIEVDKLYLTDASYTSTDYASNAGYPFADTTYFLAMQDDITMTATWTPAKFDVYYFADDISVGAESSGATTTGETSYTAPQSAYYNAGQDSTNQYATSDSSTAYARTYTYSDETASLLTGEEADSLFSLTGYHVGSWVNVYDEKEEQPAASTLTTSYDTGTSIADDDLTTAIEKLAFYEVVGTTGTTYYVDTTTYEYSTYPFLLYADWEANEYTVEFYSNDTLLSSQTLTYDDTTETLNVPYAYGEDSSTKNVEVNWSTTDTSVPVTGTALYTYSDSTAYNLTSEYNGIVKYTTTSTAFDIYTVTFDIDGTTVGTTTVADGYTVTVPSSLTEKTGYTIGADWYEISYGNGATYNFDTPATGALTLYGTYIPNEYTVVFNSNGGSGTMTSQGRAYDDGQRLSANTFTKTGYSFAGWSTTADGSVEYADGANINLTTEDGAYVTLYAVWTANQYTVRFDGNGSDGGTMGSMNFTYGTSTALSENTYTKTGYTFAGWSTNSSATTATFSDEQAVGYQATNLTLYAVWEALPQQTTPTVTIDYDNETLTSFTTTGDGTYVITLGDATTITVVVSDGAITSVTGGYTITSDGTAIAIPDTETDTWMGTTITIVKQGVDDTSLDSVAQTVVIPSRPEVSVTVSNATNSETTDGFITDTSAAKITQYWDDDGWVDFTDGDNGEKMTDLAPGGYDLYIPATAESFASKETTVTVGIGGYAVKFMTITSESDWTYIQYGDTLTVSDGNIISLPENPALEGSEYSFGGWIMVVDDGEDGYTTESLTSSTVCTSDITAYAVWGKITMEMDINIDVNVDVDVSADSSTVSDTVKAEMEAIIAFNDAQDSSSDNLQWYTIDLTATQITISVDATTGTVTATEETDIPVYEVTGPDGSLAPIEVLIPFDMVDKENLVMYRYHAEENAADVIKFTEVTTQQSATNDSFYNFPIYEMSVASVYFGEDDLDNTTEDEENVALYSGKFSTFAIGYDDVTITTPGSSSTSYYTSTLASTTNGSASLSSTRNALNSTVTVTITPDDGYAVDSVVVTYGTGRTVSVTDNGDGTYSYLQPGAAATVTVTFVSETVEEGADTSASLNRDDHFAYMLGYTDGTFGPTRNITRAEATVMFSRLLTNDIPEDLDAVDFVDMTGDEWYAEAVAIMTHYGIIMGYNDGTFGGSKSITRAEFATIASRFDELAETDENIFSDVSDDYWAISYINSAVEKGWIYGYADGTFQPDEYITRAAAVTMVNRVLERSADLEYIEEHLDVLRTFTDVSATHWAYGAIMEAANGHEYTRNDDDSETWTNLT